MGIYDREYYRREGPSFLGSIGLQGQVIKWLILINIIVFIGQILTRSQGFVTDLFVLDTRRVLHGEVWRLLTYAFLHSYDSIWHILFNMLFLWWFGSDVETIYGPKEFLAIYLVSALAGGLVFEGFWLASGAIASQYCLGASGAVTAVMVLCACHFPKRIILLFFVLPVPIWLFVVFQVVQDLYGLVGPKTGVAVEVHLAGAGFAFAYYKLHWRLLSFLPDIRGWMRARSRPRLRVFRGEEKPRQHVQAGPSPSAADMDEQLEAKLDAVLEKVTRYGKNSLTESEKQILQRASDMYPVVVVPEEQAMPLYEYACQDCHHKFEELVFGAEAVMCPRCESARLELLMSAPARPATTNTGLPMRCESNGPPCGAPWCQRQ